MKLSCRKSKQIGKEYSVYQFSVRQFMPIRSNESFEMQLLVM